LLACPGRRFGEGKRGGKGLRLAGGKKNLGCVGGGRKERKRKGGKKNLPRKKLGGCDPRAICRWKFTRQKKREGDPSGKEKGPGEYGLAQSVAQMRKGKRKEKEPRTSAPGKKRTVDCFLVTFRRKREKGGIGQEEKKRSHGSASLPFLKGEQTRRSATGEDGGGEGVPHLPEKKEGNPSSPSVRKRETCKEIKGGGRKEFTSEKKSFVFP